MVQQQPIEVSHGGRTIRGMVYRPDPPDRADRRPTALLLHGFTGQRIEAGFMFVQLARALAQRGVAAVTFDFIHSGESDGSFDQMLVSGELDDAVRMTPWLQGQLFADRSRLAVVGFSLGGLLAACLQARTAAFAAMVLVAPTTVQNLFRYTGRDEAGGADSAVVIGPHTLHDQFFDDLATLDPLTDVVQHPRPTLVLHGSADKAVPQSVAQQYVDAMQAAGVPVEFELISDADHAFANPQARQTLIDRATDWLVRQLKS